MKRVLGALEVYYPVISVFGDALKVLMGENLRVGRSISVYSSYKLLFRLNRKRNLTMQK